MVQRQKEYEGDLRQLASMRTFVREVCQESWQKTPADENLLVRLALALTEAASNIILHSDQGQQHKSITLVQHEETTSQGRGPWSPWLRRLAT